jgi:hypothetical protein
MFGTSFSDYLSGADFGDDYDPSDPLGLRRYRTRKLYPGGPPVGTAMSATHPKGISSFFPSAPEPPNSSPPRNPGDDSEDGERGEPGAPLGRSARGLALMNLGLGIASGASTNDYAGGLARGIAGFTNTVQAERQAAVAEAAQRRKEARQAQLDELERRSKEATIGHVGAETRSLEQGTDLAKGKAAREEQQRQAAPVVANALVLNVEQMAGKDSPEANAARAYASLPEPDMDSLRKLQDAVAVRYHLGDDAAAKLKGEVPGLQAQIAAGVREDPAAAAARARQQLGYEGQRVVLEGRKVSAYERQTEKQANRDPSPEQEQDDIARETDKVFAPMKAALDARSASGGLNPANLDPKTRKPRPVPTQADYEAARQAAELQARKNVKARMDAIRALRPTGKPGHYVYDPPDEP